MTKLLDSLRNIGMVVGLMLSSASFILLGSEKNNPAITNLGALTFIIFLALFIIELILLVKD